MNSYDASYSVRFLGSFVDFFLQKKNLKNFCTFIVNINFVLDLCYQKRHFQSMHTSPFEYVPVFIKNIETSTSGICVLKVLT